MAALKFFFGTMGSGKSTLALQIHHNLARRGLAGALFTQLDRSGGVVSSRLGVEADAQMVEPGVDLRARIEAMAPLDFVVCDEAQFYEPDQVDQLAVGARQADDGVQAAVAVDTGHLQVEHDT